MPELHSFVTVHYFGARGKKPTMLHCILKFGFSTRTWLSCSSRLPLSSSLTSSCEFFPFFGLPCIWHAHDIWAVWAGEIWLQIVCFTAAGHVPDMGAGTWNMMVVVVPCHCCCRGGSSNCWCKAWIWLDADRCANIGLHACFHFNGFSQITHHLSHCWPVYTMWLNALNCKFCYFPNALQLVIVSHCFVNYAVDISCFYTWFHLK